MEGKNSNSSSSSSSSSRVQEIQVAPFVLKTYEMVGDPTTDGVIRWGRENNSFVVVDPTLFSNFLLPSYFKHNNFSSFVRQLNTYGFRKVEADRWEFAHESFLRGQTRLLPLVVRRKKNEPETAAAAADEAAAASILREVGILRREQQSLERELQEMSKRLSVTERRPQQMISFLSKVADDPNFLRRLVTSKKLAAAKKQRVPIPPPPPPAPPPIETGALFLLEDKAGMLTISGERPFPTAVDAGTSGGGYQLPALCEEIPPEFGGSTEAASVYPFCLLGHDFF